MSDDATTTTPEGDEEPEFTSDQFVELRDAHKARGKTIRDLKAELKELRAFKDTAEPQLRAGALKDAGFDPDPEKNPQAKAILALHQGDWTAEAIKATASEYGLLPEGETTSGDQMTDEQRDALEAAQRSRQTDAAGTSSAPQTDTAQIQAAQAKGDWAEYDRLMAEKRAAMLRQ